MNEQVQTKARKYAIELMKDAKRDEEKCLAETGAAELVWGGIISQKKLELDEIKKSHMNTMLGFSTYEVHKKSVSEWLEKRREEFSEVKQ